MRLRTRYLETHASSWTFDAGTWTGFQQTSHGALRSLASPITDDTPFTLATFPAPHTSIKSLKLPPCRRSLLPKLVRFQAECLWPYRAELTCIAYCVWGCNHQGWAIDLFAASHEQLSAHTKALQVFGVQCDRCIPEAVALKAYLRVEFPAVPCAIIIHVQTHYCTFLLIADDQIAAQVTLKGALRDLQRLTDTQRAKGRQILSGLQDQYRQMSRQHTQDPIEAIALLITGNRGTWNWQTFAHLPCEFLELGTENCKSSKDHLNAEALGLLYLAKSGEYNDVHLASPLENFPSLLWEARALRGLATLALALIAVVIQINVVQSHRARASATCSLAKLARYLSLKGIDCPADGDILSFRAHLNHVRAQLCGPAHSEQNHSSAILEGLKWLVDSWRDWPRALRVEEFRYREATALSQEEGTSSFFLRVSTRTARDLAQFLQHLQRQERSRVLQFLHIEHKALSSVEVRFALGGTVQAQIHSARAQSPLHLSGARA